MKAVQSFRFLLVYPETPETYWSYKHALPFVGKKALLPPLGLATIAAMVPDTIDCRIVDLNIEPLHDETLASADLVLLSAMIVQKRSFEEIVARCNRLSVPVVAGGPYPTSCTDEIVGVDYFVLGEGERTFPVFLSDFLAGKPKPRYDADEKPALCEAPVPRYELLSVRDYETMPVQFSRGCPFDCEFCDIVSLFGRRTRTKSPEQFLRELDAVYATGFRGSVFVVDDNFIGNRRHSRELLRHVSRWQQDRGYPFRFSTEASIDLASDGELLSLMVASGFTMTFVGIETPSSQSLAEAGKTQNLRHDVAQAVRHIQSRGIEVTAGFIIGFDTDTPDIFVRQIRFIQRLAVPTAMVGLLMALPNTKLHERLEREGRMRGTANGNNTHDAVLNFETVLPREVLEAGYRRVLRTIYRPRRYYDRCLALLERSPAKSPVAELGTSSIKARELSALLQSIIRQTFSWYGPEYLRYITKAIWKRPFQIVRAVTMSVLGHHFMTITRNSLSDHASAVRRSARERIAAIRADARRALALEPPGGGDLENQPATLYHHPTRDDRIIPAHEG